MCNFDLGNGLEPPTVRGTGKSGLFEDRLRFKVICWASLVYHRPWSTICTLFFLTSVRGRRCLSGQLMKSELRSIPFF